MLYNPSLLINEMILFGDTLLNMPVNVKLLSNKNQSEKIIFNTVYQYMTDSSTAATRTTFRGRLPLQQIRMYQKTISQLQSRQNNFVSTYGSVGGLTYVLISISV